MERIPGFLNTHIYYIPTDIVYNDYVGKKTGSGGLCKRRFGQNVLRGRLILYITNNCVSIKINDRMRHVLVTR